ncbi:MAG: KUP/HAK/KT family potassium transporter [Chitinophagales bacterium]|nr:KUP/HAK/KT family potassium transporter [Chitinophagales bacterium]HNI43558.1 KUP/HAK/KT family potassium transporter [Chitinophagales bacterium]
MSTENQHQGGITNPDVPQVRVIDHHHEHVHVLSAAGVLITLGIVFGDIGTSPLYVMKAIGTGHTITKDLVLGGISCIFWTLTLVTSFKYVLLALNADNNGEGGIFALYALVRRYKAKWLVFPAIIGCSALISDGFITPPISISSAVEGLRAFNPELNTVPIVIGILIVLFGVQQFGTTVVGRAFGPIMLIWFSMLAILGTYNLMAYPGVLVAINPMYAIKLLSSSNGFWILGAVFLCTTGAEALYSDLGHCGKGNIRVSWSFVKIALLLNYFGQGAWMLTHIEGQTFTSASQSPFYSMMPEWFLPYGIVLASGAAIIASQALISGTFTMFNEAMKLKLWANLKVNYPSHSRGQIYLPAINWLLLAGCISVVLIFRESSRMEAAYGLAITMDMLMTTTVLTYYLVIKKYPRPFVIGFALTFYCLELMFFASNVIKIPHGGWFTLMIATIIFIAMFVFYSARRLRDKHTEFLPVREYIEMLQDLQKDETVPKEATNLVYLSMANDKDHLDSNIIYSIFRKRPKRADIYWFVHIEITDKPYGTKYSVDTIIPRTCFFVRLKFGFKVEHKVNLMFEKIVTEMINNDEVDELSHYPSLRKYGMPADFKFIILNTRVSADNQLSPFNQFVVTTYRFIKSYSLSTVEDFGLELGNVEEETVPINVAPDSEILVERA